MELTFRVINYLKKKPNGKRTPLCSRNVLEYVRILVIKTHIIQLARAPYASQLLVQVTQRNTRTGLH